MAENKFNFSEEIFIDLDALHTEWKDHASVRYKYASEVSYLDRVLKKIGEKIATIRAKLIQECKTQNPKFTVQQIEAFCIENSIHIKIREEQIDAEYELNMAKNALRAFDDRKNALENEVKLWGANYFSSPTEERVIETRQSISDKANEKATNAVRTKMNRKRRTQ